jgi:hypothetical protein
MRMRDEGMACANGEVYYGGSIYYRHKGPRIQLLHKPQPADSEPAEHERDYQYYRRHDDLPPA